jgi:nitric oxide reductase subunit B
MLGMVGALLVSGMAQTFYERAIGGSTFGAFQMAQQNLWFLDGMYARLAFGRVFGRRVEVKIALSKAVPQATSL